METYENQIKYNDDGSVNVPFDRAAEWYISNANLLKNHRLKNQSRQITPKLVKAGILTVERVQEAIDYLTWKTKTGTVKSTNRIDDILVLTSLGRDL
ncbi:13245_t:CDS:1, partial [Rhizophagus irregularis]